MSVNTLLKLSTALHVSVDYLLHGSTQETNYYSSLFSLIETCPKRDLAHLEQIISHYIQAVRKRQRELISYDQLPSANN